jgi:hypothetical protein
MFLATFNCYPNVTFEEADKTYYKNGVVYLSHPITKAKIVHEMVHDCQEQNAGGPAEDRAEWNRRERAAKWIELQWIQLRNAQ